MGSVRDKLLLAFYVPGYGADGLSGHGRHYDKESYETPSPEDKGIFKKILTGFKLLRGIYEYHHAIPALCVIHPVHVVGLFYGHMPPRCTFAYDIFSQSLCLILRYLRDGLRVGTDVFTIGRDKDGKIPDGKKHLYGIVGPKILHVYVLGHISLVFAKVIQDFIYPGCGP